MKTADIKLGESYILNTDKYALQGYYEYTKKSKVTVVTKNSTGATIKVNSGYAGRNINVLSGDLDISILKKDNLLKEIENAETLKKEAQDKLDWMTETGSEIYDEVEFKVWSTLKLLKNNKLSELEKSKAIAALIKNS